MLKDGSKLKTRFFLIWSKVIFKFHLTELTVNIGFKYYLIFAYFFKDTMISLLFTHFTRHLNNCPCDDGGLWISLNNCYLKFMFFFILQFQQRLRIEISGEEKIGIEFAAAGVNSFLLSPILWTIFFSFLFNGLLFNYNLSKLSFLFDLFEDLSKQSLMSFYFGLKNEQFLMNFFT